MDAALIEALSAIEPYLGDVVLAGGWVPTVYVELHDSADKGAILKTRDIDLAVPRVLDVRSRTIGELLEAAGFRCELRSLQEPLVMHFVARRDSPDEVEVEFITPAAGSQDGPLDVQRGVTAQAVKFGHLLLENKWEASLSDLTGGTMRGRLSLPTPAAFALNKSLTFSRRRDPAKREKDLYYLYFVVSAFADWHEWMRSDLRAIAESRRSWVKKAVGQVSGASRDVEAEGVAAIARQRPPAALPALDADQFRQYALSTMQSWLEMLRGALADVE